MTVLHENAMLFNDRMLLHLSSLPPNRIRLGDAQLERFFTRISVLKNSTSCRDLALGPNMT